MAKVKNDDLKKKYSILSLEIEDLKIENTELTDKITTLELEQLNNEEEEMLHVQVLDLQGEIDRLKGVIYDLTFKPMKKEIMDLEDRIYILENMTKEELTEKIQWYADRTKPFHPNSLNIDGDEKIQRFKGC